MTDRLLAPRESEWVRPIPGTRGYRADAALAAVLLVAMSLSALLYAVAGFYDEPAPLAVSAACILATAMPLVARRSHPEVAAVIVAAAFAATQLLRVPEQLFSNICLFIAIYSLGAWGRNRQRASAVRALIIVGMFGWLFIELFRRASDPSLLPEFSREGTVSPLVAIGLIQIITNLLYFGGAYYFGDRAWTAARQRAALEARTGELAREREVTGKQAVALERMRIARELHDVVAHHVSVMGVQAGAARRVLATDPGRTAASLAAIEESARAAVEELRVLVTTLRSDGDDGEAASTAGVDQLSVLIEETNSAGVPARLTVVGDRRPLSATVSATAYRLVQEAITNTVKHGGPGATVDVRLRYLPGEVEVEVTDDGTGSTAPAAAADRRGLGHVGMRERVSAVGGSIEIGPRSRGGYLVRAKLPATPLPSAQETVSS